MAGRALGGVLGAGLRSAIDRVAPLRAVIKSRAAQHLIQTARGARAVREPLRFAALELGPQREAGHRLRNSGLQIFLRHRTRDVHILNEVFGGTAGRHTYEPPQVIGAKLDAKGTLRVLDLGANIGLFGAYVLSRWPAASIASFEPDPANLRLLARTIAANGLEQRWCVAGVAVAGGAGRMSFAGGLLADSHLLIDGSEDPGESGSAVHASPRVITVRTVDLFEQDHAVDLMKMDIEGGEWTILTDRRLSSLRADALVLEWHAAGSPEPDARAAAVRLLRCAGYSGLEEIECGGENGLLWAWRENPASPTTVTA